MKLSQIWLILSQDFFQFAIGPGVDGTLSKRAEKFKAHLTKKFRWDFEADLDDCAPVVVELPEGVTVDWNYSTVDISKGLKEICEEHQIQLLSEGSRKQ